MKRIFAQDSPPAKRSRLAKLRAARGEYECFQIGVHCPTGFPRELSVEAGELRSKDGTIPSGCVKVLWAGLVPVPFNTAWQQRGDVERMAPDFFPDPLFARAEDVTSRPRPLHGGKYPQTGSLWVRVEVPRDARAGDYAGPIRLKNDKQETTVGVSLRVYPIVLPAARLYMTNWFFPSLMARFCKTPLMTDEFWRTLELYAADMALHGQNTILTPLGSLGAAVEGAPLPQLVAIQEVSKGRYRFDFRVFDRWCELFFRHGFALIEGGHLAGGSRSATPFWIVGVDGRPYQRSGEVQSAEHIVFLRQLLPAVRKHIASKGWLDRFVLHISDEPHGDQLKPYSELVSLVRELAPGVPIIDAMGDPSFAHLIDQPVPIESAYEEFAKRASVPRESIWFYYCCGPTGRYPNRFVDYTLIRVRIFTWLAWKYRVKGFLHWGYNYWDWHPPQRKLPHNPYDNVTGGVLEAGDPLVVYPPVDPDVSKAPVPSIRWEIIGRAMHDYSYLAMLDERLSGCGSRTRAAKLAALRSLVDKKIVPSFEGHTRDTALFLDVRRRLAEAVNW